ncbi:MAG TPA: sigma-54 dependent transcriptional regulator [Planctomycetota bacterium]|jgi:DNA-binding NtrC family response regulator
MADLGAFLVVDDEKAFRANLALHLRNCGFSVFEAESAAGALDIARQQRIDVALVDIVMPGMQGMDLLTHLKDEDRLSEVIMITGQGSIESAVEAMRRGAFSYLTKPFKLREMEALARRALEKSALARSNEILREDLTRRQARSMSAPVFRSAVMQSVYQNASLAAQHNLSVLIEGETGVGKEVLAEYIHRQSARRNGPFSVLNSGALSDSLLDSELFGYEKGAFTGAASAHPGMIEITDGGTLLLDEIGDIAESGQIRLLRFLDRGVVRRIGSTREKQVDVRVLAATHRDLDSFIRSGKFRSDLFHRLVTVRLRVPPLRERTDDIVPLAEHFLQRMAESDETVKTLSPDAQKAMSNYSWPGNTRELRHVAERAHFAAQSQGSIEIVPRHLGLPNGTHENGNGLTLKSAIRSHVLKVLDRYENHREKTAAALGITERYLYRLLREFEEEKNGKV